VENIEMVEDPAVSSERRVIYPDEEVVDVLFASVQRFVP
jgi:hypothetical protein